MLCSNFGHIWADGKIENLVSLSDDGQPDKRIERIVFEDSVQCFVNAIEFIPDAGLLGSDRINDNIEAETGKFVAGGIHLK